MEQRYCVDWWNRGLHTESKLLKWLVCMTVLSDGIEGSAPSSKLLKWPVCSIVLTGGIEGSPLSSKLHAFDVGAMW